MIRRFIVPLTILALLAVIVVGVISAVAAGNSVPASRLGDSSRAITANSLKPSQCSSINVTKIVLCSGVFCSGDDSNDLILGTSGFNWITGGNGDDCIVGGGGLDICSGGGGNNVFVDCEITN